MKRALALLLLAIGYPCVAADAPVSEEDFTRDVLAAVSAALPTHSVEVAGSLHLTVQSKDGEDAQAYLGNIYREYQQEPSSKQDLIGRYVALMVEAATFLPELDVRRIIPVVKDIGWLRFMNHVSPDENQVWEELNSDLVVVYAEDRPMGTRYYSPEEFDEAGLDAKTLRELALANLRRLIKSVDIHHGSPVSMITTGVGYEPSVLLLEEYWNAEKIGVDGEIVVAVPSREILIFTGSRTKGGVARLRQLAKQVAAEDPYALTDQLFVFRNGKFQRFEP